MGEQATTVQIKTDVTRREFKWKYLVWAVSVIAILLDALVMPNAFSKAAEAERAALRAEVLGHLIFCLIVLLGATFLLEFFSIREKSEEASHDLGELKRELISFGRENTNELVSALKLSNAAVLEHVNIVVRNCDYIGIPASAMNQVWVELSRSIRHYYWATNSLPLDVIYQPDWRRPAIDAQAKAAARGADIKKVFFQQDKDESSSKAFLDEIAIQKSKKIQVRYCDQNLPAKCIPKETRNHLRSMDFGVFDDACVLIWKTSVEDNSVEGELIFNEREVQRYKEVFNMLYGSAKH